MGIEEWDEDKEPEKLAFGDKVETPTGETGRVTELDGLEYHVAGATDLGWYTREELDKLKEYD